MGRDITGEMTAQNAVMYENQEWVEYLCDRIPLKRPGLPNDLDGAIVFLASDASAYITGQTLVIDGGATAYQMLVDGTLDATGVAGRNQSRSKYGAKRPKAGAAPAKKKKESE